MTLKYYKYFGSCTAVIVLLIFSSSTPAQSNSVREASKKLDSIDIGNYALIASEDFAHNLDNWTAEFEKPESSQMSIVSGSVLDVSASAGATVWYRNKLSGNICISYDVTVIDSSGANDRVSDLNVFWMASDPATENLFTRNGKFSSYDNLNLYYAGIGGHDNETTRFRKYFSNGDKPVITEYLDKAHLLKGNKPYSIKILTDNGTILFYVNDVLYFNYKDDKPYTEGYFGFRTTRSHQRFDKFKIFSRK